MFYTIKGYYERGQIVLNEKPPVDTNTEVLVTFLTKETNPKEIGKRKLGGLEGQVTLPDDFNEPLDDFK